jgi:hypothetical protein
VGMVVSANSTIGISYLYTVVRISCDNHKPLPNFSSPFKLLTNSNPHFMPELKVEDKVN